MEKKVAVSFLAYIGVVAVAALGISMSANAAEPAHTPTHSVSAHP